ncbi:hypothetical protein L21SP2_0216 [Salinispira pacifica]|uniref:Uncharacterized protein n=1 Tax=Salinispira pacifica TaxID=1307761 RepID=V5WCW6_9SPIO|nr:hypothetical protein L21SP2_0216 [Salinispira pacifica]
MHISRRAVLDCAFLRRVAALAVILYISKKNFPSPGKAWEPLGL